MYFNNYRNSALCEYGALKTLSFIVIIIAVAVRWDHANSCWDMETGNWTYTHTIRRPEINNERPELKMQISAREYKVGRGRGIEGGMEGKNHGSHYA